MTGQNGVGATESKKTRGWVGGETDRQRQADRQTDRLTEAVKSDRLRQADRQTERDRQSDRQT